jgi:DNA-directed RNA polymerase
LANLCGVDKVSFADRAQWTDQNLHKAAIRFAILCTV